MEPSPTDRDIMFSPALLMENDVFLSTFYQKSQPVGSSLLTEYHTCYTTTTVQYFNGKEKDYESGFHYYGARYYWSEVLTGWLSVDPMADKYPGISPYAYCAWNPVKLVDPNGMDTIFSFATNTTDAEYNSDNKEILTWMRTEGDISGMVTLSMHGTPQKGYLSVADGIIDKGCTAEEWATLIQKSHLPDYKKNQDESKPTIFLLYSCNTGSGENSFGQQLSSELKDITIAPEWKVVVNNATHSLTNAVSKEDLTPQSWNVYRQGRKVTSFIGSPKEWINNMGGVEKAAGEIIKMDRTSNNLVD